MSKRALCVIATAMAVAVGVSPVSASVALTAPPATRAKALKIVRADVLKIARDYSNRRYRAVCSDMTKRERQLLGGLSSCIFRIAIINTFVPIRKFTITSVKLSRTRTQATVSLYVNGVRAHLVHAVAKWQGGAYRLDHESGWRPTL